jgi:hypothetical protein
MPFITVYFESFAANLIMVTCAPPLNISSNHYNGDERDLGSRGISEHEDPQNGKTS